MLNFPLDRYKSILRDTTSIKTYGKVTKIIGLVIEGHGPGVSVGGLCDIISKDKPPMRAEVVGFKDRNVMLMPLGDTRGISPGSLIVAKKNVATFRVGRGLLGRVIDGLGNPIDGKGSISNIDGEDMPIYHDPINPLFRRRITEPLDVGVRCINAAITCGKGQRMGIFAGSGVGKSTLLGMMAKYTSADINVIALIGERGRELKEFIDKSLGEEGLRRSIVIVATSDQPPLIRLRGAFLAATISEYFREQGDDVLLVMDSITRFAMAQREVGLAIGEPPTSKGYTPSVFSLLPKLIERAGRSSSKGSITAFYTVLVERDDMNDPIADGVRSLIDGHIVLSRDLANKNHYPSIDILSSISRVMPDIVEPGVIDLSTKLRDVLSNYNQAEDLINIGAYVKGSNPKIDYAIKMIDRVNSYLKQAVNDRVDYATSVGELRAMFAQ